MKRKLLVLILAMVPAAFLPLAAIGQIEPEKAPATQNEPTTKYEVFAGWGYTSLNQVSQSRSGLQGVSLSVTRDWGKYFGVTAEGGHYAVEPYHFERFSRRADCGYVPGWARAACASLWPFQHHGSRADWSRAYGWRDDSTQRVVCRRGGRWIGLQQNFALWTASLWRRYRLIVHRDAVSDG